MSKAILVINAGSSSIKFAIYQAAKCQLLARGQISGINISTHTQFEFCIVSEQKKSEILQDVQNHQQAISYILVWIKQFAESWNLIAVGHRVVHGGPHRNGPVIINTPVLQELKTLQPLAPQHQPNNLGAIETVSEFLPDLPQVACFDTAFHASQPGVQRVLPLPEKYRVKGLMKYGFHGLSYDYLVQELPAYNDGQLPEKLIIAHLGNGASACAVKNGRSVSTTMGFSTLDGLVMGSRCGSIDPGVLLHLMKTESLSVDELSSCLYEQSGLLGLSGISADIRELESSNSKQAEMALQVYIISLVKHIAALASVLQGVDAIVLSGGVGENSVFIRQQLLTQLAWLGCDINKKANKQGETCITALQSKIKVFVIAANEELIIARQTVKLCVDDD